MPEALLDAPQLVIGVDDELRGLIGEVGGVSLPPRQHPSLGLHIAIDALGRPGQRDEPIALDRRRTRHRAFGFGDLFIDPAHGAPGPIVAELVIDHPIRDSAGLLR
jgi:hypothetical protein